jgi:putative DNA methylase
MTRYAKKNILIKPYNKTVEAKQHTPVYTMHKYFARRPWNFFFELIKYYTHEGDIILDPFCGGGVVVVESLKLHRKVIGVDVNPLSKFVTEMEVKRIDLAKFLDEYQNIKSKISDKILDLYLGDCSNCGENVSFEWMEWEESDNVPLRLKMVCYNCGKAEEKPATSNDEKLAKEITNRFDDIIRNENLWIPTTKIPYGDKTSSLINNGIEYFYQLFTKRNLLALSILQKEIYLVEDKEIKDFLQLAFSSSLKWASRQSHLRQKIVEGWALHAYWIYPKSLEINVWNTFDRRIKALIRGKRYSNNTIGDFAKEGRSFQDLTDDNNANYLLVNQSSTISLPIPDKSIDCIITDPPYGDNVNYAELSDYWNVWNKPDTIMDKKDEVIINRTQHKTISDYENGLVNVFRECYRVLKTNAIMVLTFNSKDLTVVSSCIIAAAKAGFSLHEEGISYQPPINAYMTTFHAMQIGAFVGDYTFTFYKDGARMDRFISSLNGLEDLKAEIDKLISNHLDKQITEPILREKSYGIIIPFIAKNAYDDSACRTIVKYFELKMKALDKYFKEQRKQIIEKRRNQFLNNVIKE